MIEAFSIAQNPFAKQALFFIVTNALLLKPIPAGLLLVARCPGAVLVMSDLVKPICPDVVPAPTYAATGYPDITGRWSYRHYFNTGTGYLRRGSNRAG